MAKTKTVISQDDLGVTICKALGVDPVIVSNVFLRVDAGEFGPAQITLIVHANEQTKQIDWEEIIKAASVTVMYKEKA